MNTVLIEITDNRAYRFLESLEDLNVIKVIDKKEENKSKETSPTAKFRGALKLTEEQYNDFQKHVTEIRNEWHDNI